MLDNDDEVDRSSTVKKQSKKKASQDRKSMGSGSSSGGQALYWMSSFFLTWSGIRRRSFNCSLFWGEKMLSMIC